MAKVPIGSVDDSRLAVYRDLRQSNLTLASGRFVAEGRLLVDRLLASRFPVESLLVEERWAEEPWPVPATTPVYVVPQGCISSLIGFKFHRGVLACGKRLPSPALEQLFQFPATPACESHPQYESRRTLVVAVDIQDPENLGTVIRNSAAFGVDAVIVTNRCADPFSRRVLRTSMGTVFSLPIMVTPDLEPLLKRLVEDWQLKLAATVLDQEAISLSAYRRPPRLAVLFGNEGSGLTDSIVQYCQDRLTIPMKGGTDSLNVGVAAGITLFALMTEPA